MAGSAEQGDAIVIDGREGGRHAALGAIADGQLGEAGGGQVGHGENTPGILGKLVACHTADSPATYLVSRSRPMPKPALGGTPARTASRYQPYLAGFSPVSRIRVTIRP